MWAVLEVVSREIKLVVHFTHLVSRSSKLSKSDPESPKYLQTSRLEQLLLVAGKFKFVLQLDECIIYLGLEKYVSQTSVATRSCRHSKQLQENLSAWTLPPFLLHHIDHNIEKGRVSEKIAVMRLYWLCVGRDHDHVNGQLKNIILKSHLAPDLANQPLQ